MFTGLHPATREPISSTPTRSPDPGVTIDGAGTVSATATSMHVPPHQHSSPPELLDVAELLDRFRPRRPNNKPQVRAHMRPTTAASARLVLQSSQGGVALASRPPHASVKRSVSARTPIPLARSGSDQRAPEVWTPIPTRDRCCRRTRSDPLPRSLRVPRRTRRYDRPRDGPAA